MLSKMQKQKKNELTERKKIILNLVPRFLLSISERKLNI